MKGLHLLGEFYGCVAEAEVFSSVPTLRERCLALVRDAKLTVVGDTFHQFEPRGIAGTVLLAESHLAVHTWPELGFASFDIYVCNFTQDNSIKAEQLLQGLKSALRPDHVCVQRIERGGDGG